MNRYGQLAQTHWQRWRPDSYRALSDPQAYFENLGQVVEKAVSTREGQLRAQVKPTTEYQLQARRFWSCHLEAENEVLRRLVYLDPDPGWGGDHEESSAEQLERQGPSYGPALLLGLDHEELTPEEQAEADRLYRDE